MEEKIKFTYKKRNKKFLQGMLIYVVVFLLLNIVFNLVFENVLLTSGLSFVMLVIFCALLIWYNYQHRLYPEYLKFEGDIIKIFYD